MIGLPFTDTPFSEPRSTTTTPVAEAEKTAWFRETQGPDKITLRRRVGAGQIKRAVVHQRIEQPALLQIVNEKRQLAQRRHRRLGVPFHMNPPAESVNGKRPLIASLHNRPGSTQRGTRISFICSRHPLAYKGLSRVGKI